MANQRWSSVQTFLGLLLVVGSVRCELFYGGVPPNDQQLELPTDETLFTNSQNEPVVEVDEEQPTNEQSQETEAPSNEFYVPTNIGQASGVAVNNKSELVIFHRAGRVWDQNSFDKNTNVFNRNLESISNATLTVVDPSTGKLLGEHGRGLFYMPHGLTVDSAGNYWVTDVGRHQVFKLDSNFKPLLVLGEKMVPGNDDKHFCKPTDVAVAKSGEIFVADGYCNSRIMKFSADGKFIGSFGSMNSDQNKPKNGEFFVPHSLTLIEDLNLLCVADRENQRIQCFTAGLTPKGAHQRAVSPTGTFVTKAENIGKIMAIREKHHYLIGLTNTKPEISNEYDIFIMDMNTGRANTFVRGIQNAHALSLNEDGEIFVAQLDPTQVLKFSVPQQDLQTGDAASNPMQQ